MHLFGAKFAWLRRLLCPELCVQFAFINTWCGTCRYLLHIQAARRLECWPDLDLICTTGTSAVTHVALCMRRRSQAPSIQHISGMYSMPMHARFLAMNSMQSHPLHATASTCPCHTFHAIARTPCNGMHVSLPFTPCHHMQPALLGMSCMNASWCPVPWPVLVAVACRQMHLHALHNDNIF